MPSDMFFVEDSRHNLVASQFLMVNGQYIIDPNKEFAQNVQIFNRAHDLISDANPDGYVIAPYGYTLDRARSFGGMLNGTIWDPDPNAAGNGFLVMFNAFRRGGSEDLQRTYRDIEFGDQPPDGFVSAYRSIASIRFGATAAAAGLSRQEALQFGGLYNTAFSRGTNTSGDFGNNPLNAKSIPAGWDLINGLQSVVSPAEGIPTIAIDPSQAAAVLGQSFDGTAASAGRLVDAVLNGQVSVGAKFVDGLTDERYRASYDTASNKIVISADEDGLSIATVSNGFLQHIIAFPVDGTRIDTAFARNGGRTITTTDPSDQQA